MKQILHYSLLAAAAVFFISCTKQSASTNEEGIAPKDPQDETPVIPTEYDPSEYLLSFGAAFEEDKTKVEINVESGALSFEEGDKVRVYVPGTSAASIYVYNSSQSLFVPDQGQEPVAVGNNVAYVYYPSAEFTISSGIVTFTMPEAIAAGSAEDLGDKVPMAGIIPAVAKEDGHPLVTFKNLGSILRARFNSIATDGETITAVELSVTGAKITGAGTVSWDGETDAAVPSVSALGGETSITISVADGHLTSGAYKDFYFFLPASGELTAMTIKAIYGKTGGYEPYETVSRTSAMTLERNKIYKVQKSLSGFFSGGDGMTYPYIIDSETDFDNIYTYWKYTTADDRIGYNGADTFFGHANYKQRAATIDKDGDTYKVIGTSGKPFTGVYDGDGKTISNVTIGNGDNLGIFGYTSGATIKNWMANNISVTGTGNSRGAFIGYMAGGEVNNCNITGTSSVSGNAAGVGGIVGRVQGAPGTITACNSTASVDNTSNSNNATGGIVGLIYTGADGSEVSSCTVSGNVSGASCNYIGGIVGRFYATGSLTSCTTTAEKEVSGNDHVGGMAGQITDGVVVKGCKNYAAVSGASDIGGLVGLMTNGEITTKQSINYGNVTGTGGNVGGLVGQKIAGNIYTNATNNGDVKGKYNVGGLVGLQTAGATRVCFNNGDVTATGKSGISGQDWANVGGIIGRMDGGDVGDFDAAYKAENNGSVTASDGNGCGGVVGVMTNGTVAYAHSIKEVKGIHHVGGIVGILRGGAVRNCYNACNVTCTGNCIGGIVGNMQAGTVNACYSKADFTIEGSYRIGGIVGYLSSSLGASVVINCASKSTVSATRSTVDTSDGYAGGLVGRLHSSSGKNAVIANCVALSAKVYGVVDNIPCGGVVGLISGAKNNSIVDNCYSQANNDSTIGYSTNNGLTVSNCSDYSGGIYGYLKAGSVMDCYYTANSGKSPTAGKKESSNTALYGNGVKEISNNVKNGQANMSITTIGAYYNNGFYSPTFSSDSGRLYKILDIGVQALTGNSGNYVLSPTVNQAYTSSAAEEVCSDWVGVKTSTYTYAYPEVLYNLGANYMP